MRIKRLAINGLAVIFLMVLFVMLIKLGFWQLERAKNKVKQIETRQRALSTLSVKLPERSKIDQHNAQLIKLHGQLDFSKTMLLDNKVSNGVVGYEVLVPFSLQQHDNASVPILVNLGWISGTGRREQLPSLQSWPEIKTLIGYLHLPSHNPFASTVINVKGSNQSFSYPLVIPAVDFNQFSTQLNQTLYPAVVRLHENSQWGYQKEWRWNNKMTPQKHQGYAIQWFALALTLFLLSSYFIWRLNVTKPEMIIKAPSDLKKHSDTDLVDRI
jgi:surfeit locus 1 family protein